MALDTEDTPTLDRCRAIVGEGEAARPCERYVAAGSGRYCQEHAAREPRCCENGCENPALPGTKSCGEHLAESEALYPGPSPAREAGNGMARLNWAFQRLHHERPDIYALAHSGDDEEFRQGWAVLLAILKTPDAPIPEPETVRLREHRDTLDDFQDDLAEVIGAERRDLFNLLRAAAENRDERDDTTADDIGRYARHLAAVAARMGEAGIAGLPEIPDALLKFDWMTQDEPELIRQASETLDDLLHALHTLDPKAFARFSEQLLEEERKRLDEERRAVEEERKRLEEERKAATLTKEYQPKPKRPRARRPTGPIPQPTFPEPYAQARALTDGPAFRNWQELEHENALVHQAPGLTQYTRLDPGPILDWFDKPATKEALRDELRKTGLPAAVLMLTTLGRLLQDPASIIDRPLDDLILTTKGRRPVNEREREQWRQQYWRWLLLCESMTNPCRRPGRYKDPDTGDVIDTLSQEAFFRVFGGAPARGQPSFDNSTPPQTVTIGLNPGIDRLIDRHDILTRFGDLQRICSIPDGKPSGAWARGMGLTLQQLFRQRAAHAQVRHQGEENRPAIPLHFTRKQVLVFVASDVEDLLGGNTPDHARKYFDGALDLLLHPKRKGDKRAGILASLPSEVTPPPRPWKEWRQGWQQFWYEEQPLDFRPGPEALGAMLELKASAKRTRHRKGTK